MVTETILEQQCTMGTHQECHDETITEMVDENETKCTMGSRQECHDETITEMVTETIIEQQCTGKLISISEMKQNLLNHILIYHNFCR